MIGSTVRKLNNKTKGIKIARASKAFLQTANTNKMIITTVIPNSNVGIINAPAQGHSLY